MRPKTASAGFLLIEVVLYIFLFSIITIGAIYSFFSFLEINRKSSQQSLVIEEGEFLLRKAEYLITSARLINSPAENQREGEELVVLDRENSLIRLKLQGSNLVLEKGDVNFPLNNSRLEVSNLLFERKDFEKAFTVKISFLVAGQEFQTSQMKHKP